MPKFTVNVAEVYIQPVEVEAEDLNEAVNIVYNGKGNDLPDKLKFDYVMDIGEWDVVGEDGQQYRLVNDAWICITRDATDTEKKDYRKTMEGLTRVDFDTQKALQIVKCSSQASRMFVENVLTEACHFIQNLLKSSTETAA